MAIEERVSRLEGVVEQMNERLGAIERALESLRAGQETLRAEILAEVRSNFRWTVGLILGMWVTVVVAVLSTLLAR